MYLTKKEKEGLKYMEKRQEMRYEIGWLKDTDMLFFAQTAEKMDAELLCSTLKTQKDIAGNYLYDDRIFFYQKIGG